MYPMVIELSLFCIGFACLEEGSSVLVSGGECVSLNR